MGLLDPKTISTYALYVKTHLAPAFPSLLDVGPASVRRYQAARLAVVRAQTVRHELSALRQLCRWAYETGRLSDEPVIPPVPKGAIGQEYGKRRRSAPDEYSPDEIERFLAALPERTPKLGAVRARFVLAYEMALRPATVDRLSVPEHWRRGAAWLTLSPGSMKGRRSSRKPLTARAKAALESAAPKAGLVFGEHDYREQVAAAAIVAFPDKAPTFTAAHLRSAALTHFLDRGASLPAAQAYADHKRATTTDRYVRASERSLVAELAKQGRI